MYNTIKNIWLDVTPKVHANASHDDRIILEQEIELNADMTNGHGEIGNDIGNVNGGVEGEMEGDGDADEWEDLNEDMDGDADDVDDALHSIESRTGTISLFFYPLTPLPPSLHFSLKYLTSLRFQCLYFSLFHFTRLLFSPPLFLSLLNSPHLFYCVPSNLFIPLLSSFAPSRFMAHHATT
jgi:hypothetical protein